MLKRILQMSAMVLAIGIGSGAAFAVTEEDLAAPPGSFTSDMTAPANPRIRGLHGAPPRLCAAHARTHDAPRGAGTVAGYRRAIRS